MDNVIRFPLDRVDYSNCSAIDTTKAMWTDQEQAMRKVIEQPNSFEEALRAKIKLHQWRAEGYQDSNDYETAGLEISYADGLIKALHMYESWGL